MIGLRWVRAAATGCIALWGCVQAQPLFHEVSLPAREANRRIVALEREPIAPPLRYRVIVLPGSGCTGMKPVADRYFAGLLHAQILMLHKPGVDVHAGLQPAQCPDGFLQGDHLAGWLADVRSALQADALRRAGQRPVPQLLVGISEGAELLVGAAPDVPDLAGLVLVSGSGLDPVESGELQARRMGQLAAWQALEQAHRSDLPNELVRQGRSLQYWRDLWGWRQSDALIGSAWPFLQAWGDADRLVPAQSFERFAQRAQGRRAPWCSRRMTGADHGLQHPDFDGIQRLWGWLENWARSQPQDLCAAS
jgi:pimeloyl-ACP methyl ester carboxylesterase